MYYLSSNYREVSNSSIWMSVCCLIAPQTPAGHVDREQIEKSVAVLERIIANVDKSTGLAKCAFTKTRLEYINDRQVGGTRPLLN